MCAALVLAALADDVEEDPVQICMATCDAKNKACKAENCAVSL